MGACCSQAGRKGDDDKKESTAAHEAFKKKKKSLNSLQWIEHINNQNLAFADEAAYQRFRHLVPGSNVIDNLETKMKYIKTLGSGATCRVVLASMRHEERIKYEKGKYNRDRKMSTHTDSYGNLIVPMGGSSSMHGSVHSNDINITENNNNTTNNNNNNNNGDSKIEELPKTMSNVGNRRSKEQVGSASVNSAISIKSTHSNNNDNKNHKKLETLSDMNVITDAETFNSLIIDKAIQNTSNFKHYNSNSTNNTQQTTNENNSPNTLNTGTTEEHSVSRSRSRSRSSFSTNNNNNNNNNTNRSTSSIIMDTNNNNNNVNNNRSRSTSVSGSFNSIYNAIERGKSIDFSKYENKLFALKQMRKDDKDNINAFQREASILKKLSHENIVQLITCYIDSYNFYIATKFCTGGALLDFIIKCEYFGESMASYYIKIILNAIKYCHNKNIVHRDLKPGNIVFDKMPILNEKLLNQFKHKRKSTKTKTKIMNKTRKKSESINRRDKKTIDNDNDNEDDLDDIMMDGEFEFFANDAKLVIIDFGEAIEVDDNELYDDCVGTALYMPPEIMRMRHGWELKKGDVWSIGIITYILLVGKAPFQGKTVSETLRLIGTKTIPWPDSNNNNNNNNSKNKKHNIQLSKQCKNFVSKLLTKVPRSRISAEEALNHEWITNNEKNHYKIERQKTMQSTQHGTLHGTQTSMSNQLSTHAREMSVSSTMGYEYDNQNLLANIADFHEATALKKLIVNRIVNEMTEQEKALLVRGFKEMDADNSGYIDKNEVYQYLINAGLSTKEAKLKSDEMMQVLDPTKQGKITFENYVNAKTLSTVNNILEAQSNSNQLNMILDDKDLSKTLHDNEKNDIIQQLGNHIRTQSTMRSEDAKNNNNHGNNSPMNHNTHLGGKDNYVFSKTYEHSTIANQEDSDDDDNNNDNNNDNKIDVYDDLSQEKMDGILDMLDANGGITDEDSA